MNSDKLHAPDVVAVPMVSDAIIRKPSRGHMPRWHLYSLEHEQV